MTGKFRRRWRSCGDDDGDGGGDTCCGGEVVCGGEVSSSRNNSVSGIVARPSNLKDALFFPRWHSNESCYLIGSAHGHGKAFP